MKIFIAIVMIALLLWQWPHLFPPAKVENVAATEMSPAEVDYYAQIFDYAMSTTKPGQAYPWESYSAKGSFTAAEHFKSKSGSDCRKFHENLTIGHGKERDSDGVACKRTGDDGWCKLKPTAALTCAMEPPSGPLGGVLRDSGDAVESGKALIGKLPSWSR